MVHCEAECEVELVMREDKILQASMKSRTFETFHGVHATLIYTSSSQD